MRRLRRRPRETQRRETRDDARRRETTRDGETTRPRGRRVEDDARARVAIVMRKIQRGASARFERARDASDDAKEHVALEAFADGFPIIRRAPLAVD
jgi:hypothetical protein